MIVGTFNIRHGVDRADRVDLRQLADVCAGLHVDLLALQEVDKWMGRTRWADIGRRVGRRSGMAHAFGPALRKGWIGRYGNALLVRGQISDAEVIRFPVVAEPRSALVATVVVGGESVSVAVTHLSVRVEERDAQLAVLLEALALRPSPRLLLGDLNGPPGDVVSLVERVGLRLTIAGPTFPASAPTKQIDHIAYVGFDLVRAWVPDTPMSDHRPLVAELRRTPR